MVSPALEVLVAPSAGHQVDAFGRAAGENNLGGLAGVEEARRAVAGGLEGDGRAAAQFVDAAMDVGVVAAVKLVHGLQHRERLLRGRGIVKINEREPVDLLAEDGKIRPQRLPIWRFRRHINPNSSRAASVSISRLQGGSQTRNTAASLTPGMVETFDFDILLQDGAHAASGGGEGHFDFHPMPAGGQRQDLQIINQAQIDDVDGYLRIVTGAKLLHDLLLGDVRGGRRRGGFGGGAAGTAGAAAGAMPSASASRASMRAMLP